ncbi:MAG: AAA family ATPase [Candidatus Kerfeldbacteria bacterium]
MSYYIVINGPLGSGKSTNAEKLSQVLNARLIIMDNILTKYNLDRDPDSASVPADRFIQALDIAMPIAKLALKKGQVVIFDGCFYHREAMDYLIRNMLHPGYIFTLRVPVDVCIRRDKERKKTLGEDATRAVYKLVVRNRFGIMIDAKGSLEETHKKIISRLPKLDK